MYCEVLLLLPFDGDILDMSPSNSYIGQSNGIKVSKQGAFLDGMTSFNIPFFNGNFMGNVFLVQFSFKSASKGIVESSNKVMTLLSNGCKDNPPSLHLSYTTNRNILILEIATVFESLKSLACPARMVSKYQNERFNLLVFNSISFSITIFCPPWGLWL